MNKKIEFIIVGLLISLLAICFFTKYTNANAMAVIYLQSNKNTFEQGQEVEITVCIENVKTVSFTSFLYFDNTKLEYIPDSENTNIINNNCLVFVWYDDTGGGAPKEKELAKFKFKAKENGIATFKIDGEFYNESREVITANFKDTQIEIGREETNEETQEKNIKTDNAELQVLRLDKEEIIPDFDKNIYDYYLTVSSDTNYIDVLAISENLNATIEITGNNNLQEGLNLIIIKVVSEDKSQTNSYTIKVTKTNDIELANTNLETLAIENVLLNPPFDTNITHYNIEVSHDTNDLNILAITQNENAKVEIIGKDNIKGGSNLIRVIVTAPNGFSNRIYQINSYKRNKEEEIRFEEEQKENEKKLEEIYETQEVGKNIEYDKSSFAKVVVISIVSISLIILIVFYYKKQLKKRQNFK